MGIRVLGLVLSGLVWLGFSGCGGSNTADIKRVIDIPSSTNFGELYPKLNSRLSTGAQDIGGAILDVRNWAETNLPEFKAGACAAINVVQDFEFARIFGRTTLGVTLPWMQIYIRDGVKDDSVYLWADASMFVSTILHEYVHARQRSIQAGATFRTSGDCEANRAALLQRQNLWSSGFNDLRSFSELSTGYSGAESELLHRWISPIGRARDEVEAAALTVKWMSEHPDELNVLTVGGVNNWVYGFQYLTQLKALANSNCFSPNALAYEEERRIYSVEIPALLEEFKKTESGVREFLRQHNVQIAQVPLNDLAVAAAATGRLGTKCTSSALSEAPASPSFPLEGGGLITLEPQAID